jgi:hypothetical protein
MLTPCWRMHCANLTAWSVGFVLLGPEALDFGDPPQATIVPASAAAAIPTNGARHGAR